MKLKQLPERNLFITSVFEHIKEALEQRLKNIMYVAGELDFKID